ncbi:MAG: 16S rRNA (cytosine(1402)-N(4))-methyltransferase RsmH [Clostridia bacterium]|nr:16S rRNA (cytosine(1402)-N(4))-methyltransferase RsmH [Clostridiaceae bacterium]
MEFNHVSVLLNECIENLNIKPDGIYVDGTMGGAGHSLEIVKKLSEKGMLIGIDRDEEALAVAKERLKEFNNVKYVHDNHDNIDEIIKNLNIKGVDGILLDLGVSSYQIDEKTRGFTYMDDGPLDMRMDKSQKLTAEYIVNNYKEQDLARIIFEYGEEKFSRKIARNICEYRKNKKIETTGELVKIIEKSIPGKFREKNSHPAKRTFQAIRIEVNNEIEPLYNTIKNSITALNSKGRLCVITFHSLEDRMVKKAYVDAEGKCTCPKDLPYCVCGNVSLGKIITKKPILPTEKEMQENSRSRSAKLRVFEKI